MASTWRCFWRGWGTAAALWPVILLLYAVDVAFALVLAIPPAAQLAGIFGRSTMAAELIGPMSLGLLTEVWIGSEGAAFSWPLYLLVPLLFLLVATFLRGGTLAALAREPREFRWAAFFSDCARFFGRFLVLLLFFAPGLLLVGLLVFLARLLLGLLGISGLGMAAAVGALLAFLLFLLLMAMDYARISLVLDPERSAPRHLGRALWFLVRRLPRAILLGLGFALAAALIAAAYPALLLAFPLIGTPLPAAVAQQLVVLLATWQRVAMLGGEMALYRS